MLRYPEPEVGTPHDVEPFDHVEFSLADYIFEGQITKVHELEKSVSIAYLDHRCPKRNGDPRKMRSIVGIEDVELIRRDG